MQLYSGMRGDAEGKRKEWDRRSERRWRQERAERKLCGRKKRGYVNERSRSFWRLRHSSLSVFMRKLFFICLVPCAGTAVSIVGTAALMRYRMVAFYLWIFLNPKGAVKHGRREYVVLLLAIFHQEVFMYFTILLSSRYR